MSGKACVWPGEEQVVKCLLMALTSDRSLAAFLDGPGRPLLAILVIKTGTKGALGSIAQQKQ